MMKVKYLFENVSYVSSTAMIAKPEHDDGDLIMVKNLHVLDDGNEVIECLWSDSDSYYDLWSIDLYQKDFVYKTKEEAEEYLKKKGFYLQSVTTQDDDIWRYMGIRQYGEVFRIQYYNMD